MLSLHKYIQSALSLCLTVRNAHFTDEKRDFSRSNEPLFCCDWPHFETKWLSEYVCALQ